MYIKTIYINNECSAREGPSLLDNAINALSSNESSCLARKAALTKAAWRLRTKILCVGFFGFIYLKIKSLCPFSHN